MTSAADPENRGTRWKRDETVTRHAARGAAAALAAAAKPDTMFVFVKPLPDLIPHFWILLPDRFRPGIESVLVGMVAIQHFVLGGHARHISMELVQIIHPVRFKERLNHVFDSPEILVAVAVPQAPLLRWEERANSVQRRDRSPAAARLQTHGKPMADPYRGPYLC